MFRGASAFACALLLVAETAGAASAFQGLGFLPEADSSRPTEMSEDGGVVVGVSVKPFTPTTQGFFKSFSWTPAAGIRDTGASSLATAISGDGTAVGGISFSAGNQAFRETGVTTAYTSA